MTDKTPRQRWMSVLAKTSATALEQVWEDLAGKPEYRFVRPPETGLVMVRGRAGGTGMRFNLGEISMTRCVVQLDNNQTGYAYISGRNHRHAELAAVFDALLQSPQRQAELLAAIIEPLAQSRQQQRQQQAAKAAATKVDFFTMVRGPN
jgi:alpha-D-ribose 1-methylphosphonate 5-triphosphate synthase subunit PhnG